MPKELRGLSEEALQLNVDRLRMDMEAEIETIKMRYTERIEYY